MSTEDKNATDDTAGQGIEPGSLLSLPSLAQTQPRRTVRVGEVAMLLGIAPATVWDWLKRGVRDFPQPQRYRLKGRNVTCWYVDEIEAFAAKQSDMAWRRGLAGPLFTQKVLDMGNRALWCAHLLQLPLGDVWPGEPDTTPEGTDALWWYVWENLERLRHEAPPLRLNSRGYPATPEDQEAAAYLRTLSHCIDVMNDRAAPEIRGPLGFVNAGGYRIGPYLPKGTLARSEGKK